jgi:predicted MFS family arabinose efflux permease
LLRAAKNRYNRSLITGTQTIRPEIQPLRNGWTTIVLASFFGVIAGFGTLVFYTFGLFLKPLIATYPQWSRETVSAAFGAASMSIALSSPIAGVLLDRHGARRVLLPTLTIFGLAYASLALLTPSLPHLFGVFILLGLVGNACGQMGYSRAISIAFSVENRRGLAIAIMMAGTGIGAILIPMLAQRFIDTTGWRTAFALLGLLSLVLSLPLAYLYIPPGGGSNSSSSRERPKTGKYRLTREFWLITATLFLAAFSINGAVIHLAPLLSDKQGISPASAAMAVSAMGGASLVGRLVTGLLLDRRNSFGPRIAFGLLLIASAGILLLATAATTIEIGITAAMMIGFGMGGESDVVPYLLTRYYSLESFSTLYGFTWTAYAIATALSSTLMGRIHDLTGSYSSMLLWISGLTLAAAALMLFMRPYPKTASSLSPEI